MIARQLQVPIVWPVRQDAQHFLEVPEWIERVEAARGDDAEERGGGLGVGVAAVKHPRLAADHYLAQGALGAGVVERQLDVVEHAQQLALLIRGVAECLGRQIAAGRCGSRLADPAEEVFHQRAHMLVAKRLPLGERCPTRSLVRRVDRANAQQPLQAHRIPADRRLEEVPSTMRPAADEHHAVFVVLERPAFEDVVTLLASAAGASEALLHVVAGVVLGVVEEHRIAVDDGGEKVPLLARLSTTVLARRRLHQRAGGVRRDHLAVRQRISPHRRDDRRAQGVAGVLHIAAHRAAVQRRALIFQLLLEPIGRHAERKLRGDHVRHRGGVQEAARKQRLGRRRRHHRRAA